MNMRKKFVFGDMSKVLKGFEDKWVALYIKDDQVVIAGSGDTIPEAIEKAREKGIDDPILMRVPQESLSYVI